MNCEHLDNKFQRDLENTASNRTARLRKALENIINAANANPEPIHYKVRDAIDRAKEAIQT